jgi:hypothetical protein
MLPQRLQYNLQLITISNGLKIGLFSVIDLAHCREIIQLFDDQKQLRSLLPELVLIKWLNYHGNKAGSTVNVQNFGEDLKDGTVLLRLLNQIAHEFVPDLSPITDPVEKRHQVILEASAKLGCKFFISAGSLQAGVAKTNLLFLAMLFGTRHGIIMTNNEPEKLAELVQFDAEGSREERAFCSWMTSLGVPVRNIVEDLRDGINVSYTIALQVSNTISVMIIYVDTQGIRSYISWTSRLEESQYDTQE